MRPAMTGQAIRVLIVEDSPEDAELILRTLRRAQHTVTHRRVDSAKALAEELAEGSWDVILSDYSMPGFDGLRAFALVQEWGMDIPFIVVSGTVGEDVAVQAMKRGVHDYLLKGNLTRLPGVIEREIREAANRRRARTAQAALEVEERRYRSLFNSASVSMVEVDFSGVGRWLDERGILDRSSLTAHLEAHPDALADAASRARIIDVNDTAVSLFGMPGKEGLLGSLERGLALGFKDGWRRTLEGIAAGPRLVQAEATVQTLEGKHIHMIYSLQLPARREDFKNVLVTACDVTERWQLEAQMRAAQRMEAVGRLAGGVAHDFNNVLTVIQSYAEFLRDHFRDEDPARQDVEAIENAAHRATRLTNQLLAFSRRQLQQLAVISLNKCVGEIDRMLRRVIGEDIRIATSLADNLGLVEADPTQIEQILMNLAVNARDAMPTGGELTIETADIELDEVYGAAKTVKVPPGQYVMLAVTDTGTGIDAETQRKIFEPFFTTKTKDRGTGLGLSTVYGIVKQSKGYIWVYSEVGKGSTFKVYLPRVDAEAVGQQPRRRVPPSVGGCETVLLVEDEALVRKVARRILERQGYTVLDAAHGGDALQLAETDTRIDLVLTDVVMPGIGGRQVVDRVRALHPATKVVYMSGYTDNAIVHHGVLDKDTVFVQKPFSTESLLRAVREALDNV